MVFDIPAMLALLNNAPKVSKGPLLERVVWTLLGISTLVVLLRLYAKIKTARRLFIDDWLMIVASFFAVAHAIVIQIAIKYGLGRHIIHITPITNISLTMGYGAFSLLPGFLSPMFGRMSFSYSLLYLVRTNDRFHAWPLYACIVLQILVNCVGLIVFYSQCGRDLDTFWTLSKSIRWDEYCGSPHVQTKYGYFMGSWNTLTDVYLAVLPAVLVHYTSLSVKRKLGVAALLCLSFLAMGTSIVKTYEARALSEFTDYTFNLWPYVVALSVELNVVIITASLPFLRPLVPRRLRSRPRSHNAPAANPDLPSSPHLRSCSGHIPLSSGWSSKNDSHIDVLTIELHSPSSSSPSGSPAEQTAPPFRPSGPVIDEHDGNEADGRRAWTRASHGTITVTTEVEITYQRMEAPYVHAALVGLIQGEMANPSLRRI